MPKQGSILQRLFKRLRDHRGNDSTFRLTLAMVVVAIYFGICLYVFCRALGGDLDFDDAGDLARTWTLCIGPIVGTVVGYYFGGSLSTSKGSNGNRPLALVVALFYFGPTSIVTYLGAAGSEVSIASSRTFLEHWVLFAGPITGVVFGIYFSRELRRNDNGNSDTFRGPSQ